MVLPSEQCFFSYWLRPLNLRGRLCLFLAGLLLMTPSVMAEEGKAETYQAPHVFITNAFDGKPPKPQVLWLKQDLQDEIQKIMDRRLAVLRLRYWRRDKRTAWILEEVGKEQPITAGFIVDDGKLFETNVLVYRESRGWEIKYPAFRNQFNGAALDEARRMDANIDGISGATLSVNAMKRMARLALFLHGHVMAKDGLS